MISHPFWGKKYWFPADANCLWDACSPMCGFFPGIPASSHITKMCTRGELACVPVMERHPVQGEFSPWAWAAGTGSGHPRPWIGIRELKNNLSSFYQYFPNVCIVHFILMFSMRSLCGLLSLVMFLWLEICHRNLTLYFIGQLSITLQ